MTSIMPCTDLKSLNQKQSARQKQSPLKEQEQTQLPPTPKGALRLKRRCAKLGFALCGKIAAKRYWGPPWQPRFPLGYGGGT